MATKPYTIDFGATGDTVIEGVQKCDDNIDDVYTTLNALSGEVEAWTDVSSFGSGWTEQVSISYMKDPLGFVHLKGYASAATAITTVLFTLPSGYRPEQQIYHSAFTELDIVNNIFTLGAFYITTGGAITPLDGLKYIFLDGITFKAA